jgi:hypothetical protein
VPAFDWNGVGVRLAETIDEREWSELNSSGMVSIDNPQVWESPTKAILASFPDAEIFVLPGGAQTFVDLKQQTERKLYVDSRSLKPGSDEMMLELIRSISAPPPAFLLRCVSQISPTGAGDFEDLALFDATDRNQDLLLVVTRNGDDWIVFRKLCRIEK